MPEPDVVESMVVVLDSLVATRTFPVITRNSSSGTLFLFVFVFCSVRHEVFETESVSWLFLSQHDGDLDGR